MALQIYSNCIGTFVFKDKQLVDEILFKDTEIIAQNTSLGEGKELETEKAMLKKHSGAEVLGKKTPVPMWVLEFLCQKKYLEKFKTANLLVTKRKMASSLKPEFLIVQSINSIDEIDKVSNTLAKRLREWYELYNPEFSKSLESHQKFAELIQAKTKKELLAEVGITEEQSMGAEIKKKDLEPIMELAGQITTLFALREKQSRYIEEAMKEYLPNVTAIAGPMIGAKLLSVAGDLHKLCMFPASTMQLLGAEKALFRHIKTGSKPPKFGFIINHPFVSKAKPAERGKIARMLADKLSMAAKIDYFKGQFIGDKLRRELEEKLEKQK